MTYIELALRLDAIAHQARVYRNTQDSVDKTDALVEALEGVVDELSQPKEAN